MASVVNCLAAKVSLLHLLHNLPEPPSVNEPGPRIREREHCKRTLTLKHEISIAQHLAFICSYSSNPFHVTAVCIEETLAHSSLILRLAANTGQHEGLVNQLTEAARILQDEAGGSMYWTQRSAKLNLTDRSSTSGEQREAISTSHCSKSESHSLPNPISPRGML